MNGVRTEKCTIVGRCLAGPSLVQHSATIALNYGVRYSACTSYHACMGSRTQPYLILCNWQWLI